jgi:PAS domain S-box-containing protein
VFTPRNPRVLRLLRRYARIASLVAMAIALIVLIAWLPLLTGRGAGLPAVAMHPLVAATLLLLGLSLWLQGVDPPAPGALRGARAAALGGGALGGLLLTGTAAIVLPNGQLNAVAPNTALGLLLLGAGLFCLSARSPWLQRASRILALAAAIIAFFPLVGYLFEIGTFTRLGSGVHPMALSSVVSFLCLASGLLAARPERGFMALLGSDGLGGRLLRRLLPVVMLSPVLLGLIAMWGRRAWGFDPPFVTGFMVTGLVVVTTTLLWWHSGVLEQVEAALSKRETTLRTLIETSPDLIMIRDREGRYLLANPAFARMAGRSVPEILGRTDAEIFEEGTARRIVDHDQAVLAAEALQTYEILIRTPGGAERIYDTSKYPYYAPNGELIGIMAISRDITERKHLEATLREQYEKLKELDKLKGDFVNAVSHDLRTPLTSILGYAEFLEDELGGPLAPQQHGFVDQIVKSSKRLEGMVNDLLDVARLDAGTFRLHCEETDLAGRIREIVDSLRPVAAERHLDLRASLPEAPMRLVLDPQRIERVVFNLIGNSLKFTPEGGQVEVRLKEEGDAVICEVADTGIGIAPEDVPKLFKRFSQLEAGSRMKAGTGLGLSISKAQVEAHGGEIGVHSALGRGSTFWFRLPRGIPAQCRWEPPSAA